MPKTRSKKVKEEDVALVDVAAEGTEPVVEPESEESGTDQTPETYKYKVVKCKKLNVRAKANKKSSVLCIVNAGDILSVNQIIDKPDWKLVLLPDGKIGYCMSEFLEIIR